jgi:serine/threonine protein kinase
MGQAIQKCCNFQTISIISSPSDAHDSIATKGEPGDAAVSPRYRGTSIYEPRRKIYKNKYEHIGKIGQGGFSKVFLVRHIATDKLYVLKKVSKGSFNAQENSITLDNVMNEKNILLTANHQFIIKFYSCFQDEKNLYYVMEYAKGGSISKYLEKQNHFSESVVRFYSAEILMALKALHLDYRVIYRDLKPDNCLLSEDGHIKLTDFGLSTIGKKYSVTGCGTPEFTAPEILNLLPHNRMVDYWSFGCLLYLFLFGTYPFYDDDLPKQYEKIKKGQFVFPEKPFVSQEAKTLIKGLLKVDITKRLGFNGIEEIMVHKFYSEINWNDIYNKKIPAPLTVSESKLKEELPDFSPVTNIKINGFTFEQLESRMSLAGG